MTLGRQQPHCTGCTSCNIQTTEVKATPWVTQVVTSRVGSTSQLSWARLCARVRSSETRAFKRNLVGLFQMLCHSDRKPAG